MILRKTRLTRWAAWCFVCHDRSSFFCVSTSLSCNLFFRQSKNLLRILFACQPAIKPAANETTKATCNVLSDTSAMFTSVRPTAHSLPAVVFFFFNGGWLASSLLVHWRPLLFRSVDRLPAVTTRVKRSRITWLGRNRLYRRDVNL